MAPQLRKRAAPAAAAPPPKAAKAAKATKKDAPSTSKAKAAPKKEAAPKKDAAVKADKPPASNPAKDPKAGIPDGAGGVSATAEVTEHEVAKEVAAKVEKEAAARPKRGAKGAKAEAKAEEPAATAGTSAEASGKVETGASITLEGFGGEVETNEGEKTTLAKLVEASTAGVVLFTYPKASTPGCTKQACLFRDAYAPLTATGLSIYGLSTDSPKSNTTFKTKQSLPYPLLCDPSASLISAIGFKSGKSTTRGVFVVHKSGKILAVEAGGPQPTVDVVTRIVEEMGGDADAEGLKKAEETAAGEADVEMGESAADTAAEVADSAQKVDA